MKAEHSFLSRQPFHFFHQSTNSLAIVPTSDTSLRFKGRQFGYIQTAVTSGFKVVAFVDVHEIKG
jgi:hypothetical protein